MTLGYALVTFHDQDDLETGPQMVIQSINPQPITLKYSKNFKWSVMQKELQNKKVENVVVVGVEKDWLEVTLLESMHKGVYTSRVIWMKICFQHKESKTKNSSQWIYHKCSVATGNLDAYLKSQECWSVFRHDHPIHTYSRDSESIVINCTKKMNKGDGIDDKAPGANYCKLAPNLQAYIQDINTVKALWNELKQTHSTSTIASAYNKFKAMLNITIPENSYCNLAFGKFTTAFTCLYEYNYKVPVRFQSIIFIS